MVFGRSFNKFRGDWRRGGVSCKTLEEEVKAPDVLSTVVGGGGLFIDMMPTTDAPENYQVLAH